jgi:hypothetical protein
LSEQAGRALDFDYVVVGHLTVDAIVDSDGRPRRQAGGGALYSGLQAARLGLRTLILTSGQERELQPLIAPFAGEITIRIAPASQSTTFETRGSGPARVQRLRALADPVRPEGFAGEAGRSATATARFATGAEGSATRAEGSATGALPARASILHLAPVARETPSSWPCEASLVGLTAQGLVRRFDRTGKVSPCPLDPATMPRRIDAAVIAESERSSAGALFERVPIVAVTDGEGPTTVHLGDRSAVRVAPRPLSGAHDDLGAGDVFAAAFFIALRDGLTPAQAAMRGNAAAAVRISGQGPDAVGDRTAIERRLEG